MLKIYIENAGQLTPGVNARDTTEASQILKYLFHTRKGFAVDGNKIVFVQNITTEEANNIVNPKPVVEPTVMVCAQPVTKVKKTTVKSKVKVKPAKTKKKTTVKSKVKSKAKKPVAKTKKLKVKKKLVKRKR